MLERRRVRGARRKKRHMQYLVITSDTHEINWSTQQAILADEAKAVWNYMRLGKLRNIWLTEEKNDAILLFEADIEDDVKSIMDALPLVNAEMISYKVIGLTPYKGLERLFHGTGK
jgi:muconolactone delta-isomerase